MRVVYSFGQFRLWGEIPDDKVGKPIVMMHPASRSQRNAIVSGDFGTPTYATTDKMTFEYARKLDHDLVEYEYAG